MGDQSFASVLKVLILEVEVTISNSATQFRSIRNHHVISDKLIIVGDW